MVGNRDTPHILTVEVEEYFQDRAFRGLIPPAEWSALPTRVDRAVDRLLELLERYDTLATFFVDDWVARNRHAVVDRIQDAGHEVASRGKAGVKENGRAPGGSELDRVTVAAVEAKELLEELAGGEILGHRAAQQLGASSSGELCHRLHRTGFRYDSSLLAGELRRSRSRSSNDALGPNGGSGRFLELPQADTLLFGLSLGPLGGANFRQLPYALTQKSLADHSESDQPVVFGLRSWEVDRFQPELPGEGWARFRHYAGLDNTEPRLERLLAEFRFTSAREHLQLEEEPRSDPGESDDEGGLGVRRSAG